MHASREFIVRRTRSDCLANGVSQQIANAQRRRKRKGFRAADGDGVEIEWNLHADHQPVIFCCIEELPAGKDK